MGLCIYATNSSMEFNLGYGQFHNLRWNIAEILDPKVGELYHQLASILIEDAIYAERELQKILSDDDKFPDEEISGILDFLFASDCEAKISYKACKQVYDLIKDVDFEDKCFQYVAYRKHGESDYELFKKFLKECYSHHRYMRWN